MGDRADYERNGRSILLYKKKIDPNMTYSVFTIPPNSMTESINYYVIKARNSGGNYFNGNRRR